MEHQPLNSMRRQASHSGLPPGSKDLRERASSRLRLKPHRLSPPAPEFAFRGECERPFLAQSVFAKLLPRDRRDSPFPSAKSGRHKTKQSRRQKLCKNALRRSEEHTSELQSRGHLVCRLLLEKKKKTTRRGPAKANSRPDHKPGPGRSTTATPSGAQGYRGSARSAEASCTDTS